MTDILSLLPDVERILTALIALVAAVASFRNGRKINEVKVSIDGRLEQLLEQKGLASEAKGMAQGTIEGTAVGLAQGRSEGADHQPIKVDIVKVPKA